MNRRAFTAMLGGLGLGSLRAFGAAREGAVTGGGSGGADDPEILRLSRDGWMPNNEHLPVLLYRGVHGEGDAAATQFERIFERNRWPAQWRNGFYDLHHYHSTVHEVLGFAGGSARLMLGGPNGHETIVRTGDIVVLPTGTGHCRLEQSADFLAAGVYPRGQTWDICRQAPDNETRARMAALPFPASDPVEGASGPLLHLWRS